MKIPGLTSIFLTIFFMVIFGLPDITFAQTSNSNIDGAKLVPVTSSAGNRQDVNNDDSPWHFILYRLNLTLAIIAGIFCIYLGYRLFILGVTGKASLSVESKELKGQLINASPGLFFAIGGIIIVAIAATRL